jgi:hypothetical protein
LKQAAERLAKRRGLSLGALIRQQLDSALSDQETSKRESDPLFAKFKPYTGTAPKDLAERHDDYLYGKVE